MKTTISTPWGTPDSWQELAPGILDVSTSSHGGIILDDDRRDRMPDGYRRTYWEEDCDWALPVLTFSDEMPPALVYSAVSTARQWHPRFPIPAAAAAIARRWEKENQDTYQHGGGCTTKKGWVQEYHPINPALPTLFIEVENILRDLPKHNPTGGYSRETLIAAGAQPRRQP